MVVLYAASCVMVDSDEDAGPWAPVKEDRVETELEKGTLTDAQKKFRCGRQGLVEVQEAMSIGGW